MKLAVRVSFLILIMILAAIVTGCGGGGTSTPPPPISVTVSAAASQVDVGSQTAITAQLTNDSSNQGVTWSMSPAPGTGSGLLINVTGTSVTYKAPGTPPANPVTVTITATAVADGTKFGQVSITLNSVSVSTSANNYTVGAGGTSQLSAVVSGDPSNRGVTWAISPASGAGTLSNPTSTSVTYNAPPTPPANDVDVAITATSVADTTKSGVLVITYAAIAVSVTATPSSVEATGTAQVSATVNYDPSGQGVTWAISPTSGAGTLSNATSKAVMYTAPPTPPASDLMATITATSMSDATKSGSSGVTVLAITVAVTPTSALIPITASLQYNGTVNNDPTNKGAAWTVTQNGSTCSPGCGTPAPANTLNGTPTTYTAPATAPASPAVTLTATSVEDNTKSANTAITVSTGSVELVPYTLNFGTVKGPGGGSRTLTVALTNTGATALSISSITTTPTAFSQTNNCGTSVGAGLSCTVTVTFKPIARGVFHGNLVISDSSTDSPQQVALTGTGLSRIFFGTAVQSALTRHKNVTIPSTTFPNKVGTRVIDLVDATRNDPYLANGTKRELLVRLWYPASLAQGCKAAEYTSAGVWSYFSQLKGVTLPQVTTNSCWNAAMAGGQHPVVVFTHGYTGTFTDYTFLFEDLASRGYVVASVDHTYEATAVEFPNGRLVKSVLGSYLAKSAKMDEKTVTFAVSVRLDDLKFVLNELERLNAGNKDPFAGRLDMSRVALAGHSLGGLTALLGVQQDPRFRAGVILDGVLPDFVAVGTQTPMLVLTAGNDGWGENDCRLWNGLRGPRVAVNLKGAEHVTPSDAVWLARYAIKSGTMGPEKTIAAVRAYVAAFLDANLKGLPAARLLKGSSREYPDVVVTTQGQSPCGQP
ncbi:MAG TPA: choice-of-anchor D domain-containing protein [Terriglobales bacterium]|nr:choice-of-anchor D domain-containing protein [Terriglobales bacterium]